MDRCPLRGPCTSTSWTRDRSCRLAAAQWPQESWGHGRRAHGAFMAALLGETGSPLESCTRGLSRQEPAPCFLLGWPRPGQAPPPTPQLGPSSQAGRGLTCPCPAALGTPHLACGGLTYRSALLGTVALGHVRSDLFSGEPLYQQAPGRPQGSRLQPRRELAPGLARKHVHRDVTRASRDVPERVPSPLVGGGKGETATSPAMRPLTLMGRSSSGFR